VIDVQVLRGAMVRSTDGRQGRIGKVSMPWVRIEWQQGDVENVDSRAYRRGASDVHENFEVLTLDQGWLGMGKLLGSRPRGPMAGLIDDLSQALGVCSCGSMTGGCKCDKTALLRPPAPRALPPKVNQGGVEAGDPVSSDGGLPMSTFWSTQGEAIERIGRKILSERSVRHYPFKRKAKLGPGPRKGTLAKADQWDCTCNNYVCSCKGAEGQKKRVQIDRAYKAAYNREYRAWRAKQG